IINNIRPRIEGVAVYSFQLSSGQNDVAHVVHIPASDTAHQAMDKRYYKRYNFVSEPMFDYEIRDVMGRGQNPRIQLEFDFLIEHSWYFNGRQEDKFTETYLRVCVINVGSVYANYVNAYFEVPRWILDIPDSSYTRDLSTDEYYSEELRTEYISIDAENTNIKVIYSDSRREGDRFVPHIQSTPPPIRYKPILPSNERIWLIEVRKDIGEINLADLNISWEIFADNSGKQSGKISLTEIEFTEIEEEL
ncbi:MAG: hypothetical protein AAFQ07_12525, partial [Chloroflexota bacterium]